MENLADKAREAIAQVNQVILGKETIVEEVFLALLADGHVLLEDIPGVGKTSLALAFSRVMALDFHRVQFTPDVMPSDLTGFSIYRWEEERFAYQLGSVFCCLLLADEINRASPKTQSALLKVMEERNVSVEGVTWQVTLDFSGNRHGKSNGKHRDAAVAGGPGGSRSHSCGDGISVFRA